MLLKYQMPPDLVLLRTWQHQLSTPAVLTPILSLLLPPPSLLLPALLPMIASPPAALQPTPPMLRSFLAFAAAANSLPRFSPPKRCHPTVAAPAGYLQMYVAAQVAISKRPSPLLRWKLLVAPPASISPHQLTASDAHDGLL